MSADAKVWFEEGDPFGRWKGIHDGECVIAHQGTEYQLSELLTEIEECMKVRSLRWLFRSYPGGSVGLVGYAA